MIELQTDIDLFGADIAGTPKIDRAMLAAGLYASMKDIGLEEFVSLFVSRIDSIVDYAELCNGENVGQRISLLFNPHRLNTSTKACATSLYEALQDERFSKGLARVMLLKKGRGSKTEGLLYDATAGIGGLNGVSWIQEFPPHVARDLALEYGLTRSSRVLDPCAGWGGRMIGFSTVVDSYTCCEPSTHTVEGLRKLHEWLKVFRNTFDATIYALPFENVELPQAAFDFALTSPPYYDTERYSDEPTNSFNRYSSFDAWCRGFYEPLIHRTMAALKPGAAFVLNIGSRLYPLNERLRMIVRDRYVVEKQKGKLSASNGLGKDGEGESFYEIRNPASTIVLQSTTEPAKLLLLKPEPQNRPSALDFAFRQAEPLPAAQSATEPPIAPSLPATSEAVLSRPEPSFDVPAFVAVLAGKGHRVLTRDGKLFVSEASKLSAEDRATIKAHREELLHLAELYILHSKIDGDAAGVSRPSAHDAERSSPSIASLFEELRPTQSLAQFLGSESQRVAANWTPDEPPDLTGIDEVVLNFATTGLDWAHGHRPIGVTVSTLDGLLTRFLPFAFEGGNLDEQAVKRWAERELRGKKVYGSKVKFDVHHAREWGIDLEAQGCTFSDIQHMAALLDDHRKRFAIDVLAEDYLPALRRVPRLDESRHASYHASEAAERERFTAQLVGKLRDVMYPQLDEQELREVQALEDDVIPCVVEMEKNGSPIDVELLEQFQRECKTEYERLMYEVSGEAGFAFEHTASGWKRLLEHLALTVPDSFAEAELSEVDHPLVRKGQRAAQYASLNSKIFKAYPEHVTDGVLRYEINQLASDDGGTVSGRFSIGLVQQVPNHDNHHAAFGEDASDAGIKSCSGSCSMFPRRLFVPGSGSYLEADAAQIEFRLLVHHSGNAKLLQAYADDPRMSFHRQMQAMLQAYKPDMLYAHTKNYNFAAQYGARSIKLAVMMKFITEKQGEEIRAAKRWNDPRLNLIHEIEAAYQQAHPEAGALLDRASHLAKPECDKYCKKGDALHRQYKHRGYVRTLLGRRSRFPTNYKTYIGLNRVLQGTGADIMKRKLVELHASRKDTGLVMRITNHDAVLGDAIQPDTLEKVSAILNRQSYPLKVPILWECGTGANWAECK